MNKTLLCCRVSIQNNANSVGYTTRRIIGVSRGSVFVSHSRDRYFCRQQNLKDEEHQMPRLKSVKKKKRCCALNFPDTLLQAGPTEAAKILFSKKR